MSAKDKLVESLNSFQGAVNEHFPYSAELFESFLASIADEAVGAALLTPVEKALENLTMPDFLYMFAIPNVKVRVKFADGKQSGDDEYIVVKPGMSTGIATRFGTYRSPFNHIGITKGFVPLLEHKDLSLFGSATVKGLTKVSDQTFYGIVRSSCQKGDYPGMCYLIPATSTAEHVATRKGGIAFNVGNGAFTQKVTDVPTADGKSKTPLAIKTSTSCLNAWSLCCWLRQKKTGPDRGFGETEFAVIKKSDFVALRTAFISGELTIEELMSYKHETKPKLQSVALYRGTFGDAGPLEFTCPLKEGYEWY